LETAVKKFIAMLFLGAFLAVTAIGAVGCGGDSDKDKKKDKDKDKDKTKDKATSVLVIKHLA
jgi:hypothetical protein